LIREQVRRGEVEGVEILCCPEAMLGGLADDGTPPERCAIDVENGALATILEPLASDSVTTILGFTEIDRRGRLYNAAVVFHRGEILGIYRKLHPAIRRSVYEPGDGMPVFEVHGLTFGILICRDSNFAEPARFMASQGAAALFVPTNNGLPPAKGGPELPSLARGADIARAIENRVWVIRADVAGRTAGLASFGSSGIVGPDGTVLVSAMPLIPDLLIAEIQTDPLEEAPAG
jgi:predicted amidohydrolase